MKYIKKIFEKDSISRMPQKCDKKKAMEKMQLHSLEKWNIDEQEWLKKFFIKFDDFEILEKGAIIRSSSTFSKIFINKIQDNWFVIIRTFPPYDHHLDEFYICDEFIEVQNFLQNETYQKI